MAATVPETQRPNDIVIQTLGYPESIFHYEIHSDTLVPLDNSNWCMNVKLSTSKYVTGSTTNFYLSWATQVNTKTPVTVDMVA
jgi:hypothetical protein